jgi:hypothetical protein
VLVLPLIQVPTSWPCELHSLLFNDNLQLSNSVVQAAALLSGQNSTSNHEHSSKKSAHTSKNPEVSYTEEVFFENTRPPQLGIGATFVQHKHAMLSAILQILLCKQIAVIKGVSSRVSDHLLFE